MIFIYNFLFILIPILLIFLGIIFLKKTFFNKKKEYMPLYTPHREMYLSIDQKIKYSQMIEISVAKIFLSLKLFIIILLFGGSILCIFIFYEKGFYNFIFK